MLMRLFLASFLTAGLILTPAAFAETDLELFTPGKKWSFSNGAEFPPGGKGSFSLADADGQPAGSLEFDFSDGGIYVAASTKTNIPEGYGEIRFDVKTAAAMALGIRLVDSTGQVHQTELPYTNAGEWQTLRVDLLRKAGIRFGGANDGTIHFPITGVSILVNRRGVSEPGEVFLKNVVILR